jgi:outer membrane cobalamin receptor
VRSSLLLFLLVSLAAFADQLTLTVTAPDGQPVPDARVVVYRGDNQIAATSNTTGNGTVRFDLPAGDYTAEVLAPTFAKASETVSVSGETNKSIRLHIATPQQTIQVTAAGSPMETVNSGANVSTVDTPVLENQQPIAVADTLRLLPGAVVSTSGRRGGIAALFVRGGESRYNKVIVDGVPVNEVGGQYDFGTPSLIGADRIEFMRGAQSTLYGSDAMTSVVQTFSAQGTTRTPEIRFGADGGTFSTAHGYASLAGASGRFDYNIFANQFNTEGQGANDDYSSSSQGANLGVGLTSKTLLRFRLRHENSRTGVQGQWVFGGVPQLTPDLGEYARANNFLASLDLTIAQSAHWRHRFSGYEYNHRRYNADNLTDRTCDVPFFLDCPFFQNDHQNRAGFNYQGEWSPLSWARTTFGYDFEDENGFVDENFSGAAAQIHGLRRNHAGYVEQIVTWKRLTTTAGVRVLHNESFGNKAVPRVALSLLALKGGSILSGTHLRFSYAEGFKEPTFEESFGVGAFGILPNPDLQPEENRSFEAGFDQSFVGGRYSLTATYFNSLFRNLVTFQSLTPLTSQYTNLNKSMAQGAEIGFHTRLRDTLRFDASYTYDSTQILEAPLAFDPTALPGRPLLRRPKHAGTLLLNYSGHRWGGFLGGSFVGRRADADFLFGAVPPVDHTAGYAFVNLGGWYAINSHVTAYANVDNVLNRRYEEVAGYPALKANFRAGMRFRFGGE